MMSKYPKIHVDMANKSEDQKFYYMYLREKNQGFRVDGIAAIICAEMTGQTTLRQIIDTVAEKQGLELNSLESNCMELIRNLDQLNLITWSESPV